MLNQFPAFTIQRQRPLPLKPSSGKAASSSIVVCPFTQLLYISSVFTNAHRALPNLSEAVRRCSPAAAKSTATSIPVFHFCPTATNTADLVKLLLLLSRSTTICLLFQPLLGTRGRQWLAGWVSCWLYDSVGTTRGPAARRVVCRLAAVQRFYLLGLLLFLTQRLSQEQILSCGASRQR